MTQIITPTSVDLCSMLVWKRSIVIELISFSSLMILSAYISFLPSIYSFHYCCCTLYVPLSVPPCHLMIVNIIKLVKNNTLTRNFQNTSPKILRTTLSPNTATFSHRKWKTHPFLLSKMSFPILFIPTRCWPWERFHFHTRLKIHTFL